MAILEVGGSVVITDLDFDKLHSASAALCGSFNKEKIDAYVMDVTDEGSVQGLSNTLCTRGIRIDVLINNAAIDPKVNNENVISESSRFENFELSQWSLQLDVGLTGAFLCTKHFGSEMVKDGLGGVVLNISSDLSVISPDQRLYREDGLEDYLQPVKPITYSVVKSGLIGFTRYVATYWADKGVRCNALSPGGIFNDQSETFIKKIEQLIPLGRMAQLDEYRSTVQYLCSNASSYMNGQNVIVDGGRSVL